MEITNYHLIKKLRKKIENETFRYGIIFLNTFLGAYEARIQEPENFTAFRQISGQIAEARYIAREIQRTLNLLNKENVKVSEVYDSLTERIEKSNKKITFNDGIYYYLKEILRDEDLISKISEKNIHREIETGDLN